MNFDFSMPQASRSLGVLTWVVVATIVAMTALLVWQLRVHELRHAEGETVALSHIIGEQTTRALQGVDLALDSALNRLEQAGRMRVAPDQFAIHSMLRSRMEGMPQLRSLFIADANGRVVSSALSHPVPEYSVKDRYYFEIVRDRPDVGRYVSSPLTNRVDGKTTFFFARRIPGPKGEFAGAIVASVDVVYFETLYDLIKLDSVSPIVLRLDDGTLIARTSREDSSIARKVELPALAEGTSGAPALKTVRKEGDDAGITTYRRISGFPMVLAIGNRDHAALADWRNTAGRIAAAGVVNILLVLLAATFLVRRQQREAVLAQAAQESSNQLSAMVGSAMDAIVTIDSEHRIAVFNPSAQRMFGYTEEEIRGQPLDLLIPERFRAAHERHFAAFRDGDVDARVKDARMDITGLRADGTEFPVESTIAKVTIDGRTMFTAILRDVGDRRRAENALRESHQQLRELTTSLQTVREEERISIARELHDELGQQLLRLRMDLSWLSGRIKDLSPGLLDKVSDMKNFVAGTVDTLRRVTTRLRPPLLDDLGLAEAAQWQLGDFSSQTGITVESSIAIDDEALNETISINVFRILQESLTNVARHAEATLVKVSLATTGAGLTLDIADNGRGAAFGDKQELGHGLVGIRERTLMLGGQMEIASAPGAGFTVRVRIPLQPAGEPA